MKKFIVMLMTTVLLVSVAGAHCQIPCGIYDDQARIAQLEEHVKTIEKSMNEIIKLSAATNSPQTSNQMVRWVNNKDEHADKLTEIVTYYFLTQRIKASEPADKYTTELKELHGMMVAAMKCKQTVDLRYVAELRNLIHDFEHTYFGSTGEMPQAH
ncbi:MAG: nickel superoxide dismutase [Verrucomicrobiota bacterium]|jgi:nickel superoxide dismutase|nr:nickel superoxide dismutase [Verrucomicrobiota bacterium]MDK2963657.1 nickel superoxide dismutase [Verrucomicrobiota bacterium]